MRENSSTHTQAPTAPRKRAIGPQNEAEAVADALWWLKGEGRTYGPFLSPAAAWHARFGRTPLPHEVRAAYVLGWSVGQGPGFRPVA